MNSIRKYHFFVTLLMLIGWSGRLVAGSIPIPPFSPFSLPSTAWTSTAKQTNVHAVLQASNSSSKEEAGRSISSPPRPWYALFTFTPMPRVTSPLQVSFTTPRLFVPIPDLKSVPRPPSA